MRTITATWILILALAVLSSVALGATYEVSMGEGHGEPGQIGMAPVYLNSATEVASIEFQVNYDASFLTVVGVTNPAGSLGEAFGVDYEAEDGRLIVRLFRMDGLVSGSGLLCNIQFQVNSGAEPALWCDLAMADAGLATQYGGNVAWLNSVSQENNKFWTLFSAGVDSDGDGLSDYEEQMANGSADYDPGVTDTDVHNHDTDGDGMRDGWETAHNLAPLRNDANQDADGDGMTNLEEYTADTDPLDGDSLLTIIGVRTDPAGLRIDWKGGSMSWQYIQTRVSLVGTGETWSSIHTVSPPTPTSNYVIDAGAANSSRFYRIKAER
ncbi:MAG: cohesin domain-containing protein [Kiritimatiellae bacterium]|nr:cohesin domain-containing protein [Kiritimatiellia bacterium]